MSPLKALVDAVRSIPRRSQNIVRRLRNEPILRADGSTTGTLDAHATPEEKLKQAAGASNVKDQRNAWMDLIMGKQFDDILDETFAKCAALNTGGGKDSLDAAELALAVQELYNKLDEMMGGTGKLPIIKEDVKTILAKYDADNSGCLDRAEFQGFARTYFARLEWPLWKTAARGAGKGVLAYCGVRVIVKPIVMSIVGAVLRKVMPIIVAQIKNLPAGKLKNTLASAKSKLKLGRYAVDDDGDGIPDVIQDKMTKEMWDKRKRTVKTIAIFAATFSGASVAGWV
jgi:hypothetical protein